MSSSSSRTKFQQFTNRVPSSHSKTKLSLATHETKEEHHSECNCTNGVLYLRRLTAESVFRDWSSAPKPSVLICSSVCVPPPLLSRGETSVVLAQMPIVLVRFLELTLCFWIFLPFAVSDFQVFTVVVG